MTEEKQLWGAETEKAIGNFPISGEQVPASVIHWLGRIKASAARANAELEKLDDEVAAKIATAGDDVGKGTYDEHFPLDVFQTGSGTSSNMNTNEVIANLTGGDAHPNDHVNMGQSSNDVFPSAVHLATADEATNKLLPALDKLASALETKADEFADVVKSGRTHLMDAVPVTLGQEFGGYAAQIRLGAERVEDALKRVLEIPLGGTAIGTGLNTHPEFAEKVRQDLGGQFGLDIKPPRDPFESQASRDALVEISGALKVIAVSLIKIANDIRWMGSGPRTGLAEIKIPELQKGSSIMPGKVNPVICEVVTQVGAQVIGNDTGVTFAGTQGNFEINLTIPMMARNILDSIELLTNTSNVFVDKCIAGIEANRENCTRHAEATLATATALNPHIGYDRAAEIVKDAANSGRPLREVAREHDVEEEILNQALDLPKMAKGNT